jgi:thymidine kinase
VSHDDRRIECRKVRNPHEILDLVEEDTKVVGIDEVQFLDDGLVDVCEKLAGDGKRVIVAGLDQDYRGKPFEPIPQLLALAESITKTMAVCMRCGAAANKTQRLIDSDERIVVGAGEAYEPRCRKCYNPPQSG